MINRHQSVGSTISKQTQCKDVISQENEKRGMDYLISVRFENTLSQWNCQRLSDALTPSPSFKWLRTRKHQMTGSVRLTLILTTDACPAKPLRMLRINVTVTCEGTLYTALRCSGSRTIHTLGLCFHNVRWD